MAILAYAPASLANVSVGFDLLGGALRPVEGEPFGDRVRLQIQSQGIRLRCHGPFATDLSQQSTENLVYQAAELFLKHYNIAQGVSLELEKNLPICSGLGSSASSIVAACGGLNALFKTSLPASELLLMMGELEGGIAGSTHLDNVAPAFLGGMQLIHHREKGQTHHLPCFEHWRWVVCYPGYPIATAKARARLPSHYPKQQCIDYGRRLAGFVQACYLKEPTLAASLLQDELAEPYRQQLIPGFSTIKNQLMTQGALAVGISGSGPSLFALAQRDDTAVQIAHLFSSQFIETDSGFCKICHIDPQGLRCEECQDETL